MRPDQCHGEPRPTEIIPDTSKYTDLPNKLRAFALFAESNDPAEYRTESGKWRTYDRPGMLGESVRYCANGTHEYRLKPKPRELWMIEFEDGSFGHHWESEKEARVGMPASTKVVRFVEQP